MHLLTQNQHICFVRNYWFTFWCVTFLYFVHIVTRDGEINFITIAKFVPLWGNCSVQRLEGRHCICVGCVGQHPLQMGPPDGQLRQLESDEGFRRETDSQSRGVVWPNTNRSCSLLALRQHRVPAGQLHGRGTGCSGDASTLLVTYTARPIIIGPISNALAYIFKAGSWQI